MNVHNHAFGTDRAYAVIHQKILLLTKGNDMLGWAITFLIIALLAGLFGFGLVGGMAYGAAKICFFVFLILAVISLVSGRRVNV